MLVLPGHIFWALMSLCRGRVRDTQFPCGVCVAHSVHALGNASDSHAQTVSCLFPTWKSLFYFLLLLIWPLLAILRRPRRNILLLWASRALSLFGCARSQQRVVCSPGINIYISTHMGAEAQSVHVCGVHAWRTHTNTHKGGEKMYCLGLATLQTILHISALTSITLGWVCSCSLCEAQRPVINTKPLRFFFLPAHVTCARYISWTLAFFRPSHS